MSYWDRLLQKQVTKKLTEDTLKKYGNQTGHSEDGSFLKDYYDEAIPFLKRLTLASIVVAILIGGMIFAPDIKAHGLWQFIKAFIKRILACDIKDISMIVSIILVYAAFYYLPGLIIKIVYRKEVYFDTKCVCISYNGKKARRIQIQYETIAELLNKKKMYIKNGRIYIPCPGADIAVRLDNDNAHFPANAFRTLSRLSGRKLPTYDIDHQITRSGFPYALRNLFGGISAGIGVLLSFLWLVLDWDFTYEKIIEVLFTNFFHWLAIISVGIALISRIIFYIKGVIAYWEYRDSIRVTPAPILVDILILTAWFSAYLLYR